MTIDILTYQLKYKHDPMVLELLSAYETMDVEYQEKVGELEKERDAANDEASDMKKTISEIKALVS